MNVTLRRGTPDDAQTCGRICYEAFKAISTHHNFPPDFSDAEQGRGLLAYLLSLKNVYSVIAEVEGRVVGSNFLWETSVVAGVGPITVAPTVQNMSIGRLLMDDVLRRAHERGFVGVRLVQAAYHNRSLSLYTKLGFDTREPLSIIQGEPLGLVMPGRSVRAASERDLESCNGLCLKIHGLVRGPELVEAIAQGTANVVEHDGRITGYATLIGFLGHAVGENNEDLKALIGATPAFAGPGFLLPTRNSELLRWCLTKGLRIVQPMTLMSTGMYNEPAGAFLPSVIY
jgi:GNAT superfamily N-acetyltransferase